VLFLRIVIVDDHPLVRRGLSAVLSYEKDIEIVGEASNVDEAVDVINKTRPEQVLVDLRLENQSGLDIFKRLAKKDIKCKFAVLTSSLDEVDFKNAEELGVDGYILKEALPEEIIYAVHVIDRGRKYYDPGILEIAMKKKEDNITEKLTEREKEVLQALGKGLSNKEIARALFITEYTVKKHVSQILAKLNLNDRTQAALYANKIILHE
jgi:two-component system, NarL family, nitrate/nitrite response regulator NarL